MRRKKNNNGGGGGGDSWLNTYADMVTLLLTFFAVMLSISTVNLEKYNAFIRSFSNLPPEVIEDLTNPMIGPGVLEEHETDVIIPTDEDQEVEPDDFLEAQQAMTDLYRKLKEYVEENGMEDRVSLDKIDQVIFIRFESSVFFHPDSYVLLPGGRNVLAFIGDGIKEYEDMVELVSICGHTATVPDNSSKVISDWMLSGERAAIVAMFMEDEKQIDPKKILLLGFGKNLPVATNDNEEGRKENRRVEMIIVGRGSDVSFQPYENIKDLYQLKEEEEERTSGIREEAEKTASREASDAAANNPDILTGVSPYA